MNEPLQKPQGKLQVADQVDKNRVLIEELEFKMPEWVKVLKEAREKNKDVRNE